MSDSHTAWSEPNHVLSSLEHRIPAHRIRDPFCHAPPSVTSYIRRSVIVDAHILPDALTSLFSPSAMQRRAACTALGWASTRWTTVTSASTPHRRLLPPLSTALRRCLATATSPPPPPSSSAPNGNTKPAPLPSPSSSTSASSPLSGEGDEAFVCPPPLSRYFSPIAPDPALFRRYVQCLGQRVPDPSLPPLPSSVHVRPASSSSATSQPLISKDQEIFANQDCPLQHILWWGFDYDYVPHTSPHTTSQPIPPPPLHPSHPPSPSPCA